MVISQIYWRLTRVTKNFGKLLKMSTLSIYKLSTRCDGLRVKHYLLNGFGLTVFQNWNVIVGLRIRKSGTVRFYYRVFILRNNHHFFTLDI